MGYKKTIKEIKQWEYKCDFPTPLFIIFYEIIFVVIFLFIQMKQNMGSYGCFNLQINIHPSIHIHDMAGAYDDKLVLSIYLSL